MCYQDLWGYLFKALLFPEEMISLIIVKEDTNSRDNEYKINMTATYKYTFIVNSYVSLVVNVFLAFIMATCSLRAW